MALKTMKSKTGTTKRETPYSKKMLEAPSSKNVVSFNRSEIRALTGKAQGKCVLVFETGPYVHFYGMFSSSEDAISRAETSQWYLLQNQPVPFTLIGEEPEEVYVSSKHDGGTYYMLRYTESE